MYQIWNVWRHDREQVRGIWGCLLSIQPVGRSASNWHSFLYSQDMCWYSHWLLSYADATSISTFWWMRFSCWELLRKQKRLEIGATLNVKKTFYAQYIHTNMLVVPVTLCNQQPLSWVVGWSETNFCCCCFVVNVVVVVLFHIFYFHTSTQQRERLNARSSKRCGPFIFGPP